MRGFRRRLRGGLVVRWLILFMGVFGLGLKLLDWAFWPSVLAIAEMDARARALSLINQTVIAEIGNGAAYGELVQYSTDHEGRVTMVAMNTPAINAVVGRAVAALERDLAGLRHRIWRIPLGQVLGRTLVTGLGPSVPVRLYPMGAVTAGVTQQFVDAGINQTRHSIMIQIRTRLRIMIPLTSAEVEVASEFPLAEGIIVGPVPAQFWQGTMPLLPPGAIR